MFQSVELGIGRDKAKLNLQEWSLFSSILIIANWVLQIKNWVLQIKDCFFWLLQTNDGKLGIAD